MIIALQSILSAKCQNKRRIESNIGEDTEAHFVLGKSQTTQTKGGRGPSGISAIMNIPPTSAVVSKLADCYQMTFQGTISS
jgi:hypothetical protein